MVNTALCAAMARSAAMTRLNPAPAAVPFTAAMTGALPRASRESPMCRSPAITLSRLFALDPALAKAPRSPPAQNALPAPVSTTARTSGSSSQRTATSANSFAHSGLMALNASGRLMVIVPTPSATSNSNVS